MYVRIKRKNQTFFYHVEPSDSFLTIKQRLADGYKLQPNQIALYSTADKVSLWSTISYFYNVLILMTTS